MNNVAPRTTPASAAIVILLATMGTACGTLKERAEAVTLTASPTEVAGCEFVGHINIGTYDSEYDQRQRELRFETARKGANVLKVHSFALATGGQAYRCDAPLNRDRVAS